MISPEKGGNHKILALRALETAFNCKWRTESLYTSKSIVFFVRAELSVFILLLLASRPCGASQRQNKKVFLCVFGVSSEAGGEKPLI